MTLDTVTNLEDLLVILSTTELSDREIERSLPNFSSDPDDLVDNGWLVRSWDDARVLVSETVNGPFWIEDRDEWELERPTYYENPRPHDARPEVPANAVERYQP